MIEKYNRPIPDYNRRMFEDGYEPWEILAAAHKKMLAAASERQPQTAPTEDYSINIKSEVKVK